MKLDWLAEKEYLEKQGADMKEIGIWAHRGVSGNAPENTMEAFELAVQMGADWSGCVAFVNCKPAV